MLTQERLVQIQVLNGTTMKAFEPLVGKVGAMAAPFYRIDHLDGRDEGQGLIIPMERQSLLVVEGHLVFTSHVHRYGYRRPGPDDVIVCGRQNGYPENTACWCYSDTFQAALPLYVPWEYALFAPLAEEPILTAPWPHEVFDRIPATTATSSFGKAGLAYKVRRRRPDGDWEDFDPESLGSETREILKLY